MLVWSEQHGYSNSRRFVHATCGTELDQVAACPACGITPPVGDIITERRRGRAVRRDDPVTHALREPHRLLEPLDVA
jgi:hypothetical protein